MPAKSQSDTFFIKWRLNILRPEHLKLTLKTIWSLSLANKKPKMSQAHQEKHKVSLYKVLHNLPYTKTLHTAFKSVHNLLDK